MGWLFKDDRIRQLFEDQFEPEGSGFIYRKSMKGEPIRVTAEERAGFVEGFVRMMRWTMILVFVVIFALVGLLVAMGIEADDGMGEMALYGASIGVMILFAVIFFRAWNKPARQLQDRASLGNALTREEAREAFIRRTSYGQFATYAALSVFMFWNFANKYDVLHGWARLAPVALVALLGAFAWRMFQKWQLERDDRF